MKKKLILLSLIIGSIVYSVIGQTTIRQGVQQGRIVEGAASGELTKREIRNLERQQRRVNRHKKATKADGVVTRQERASLRMHQNKANRDIRRKKNNARSRG